MIYEGDKWSLKEEMTCGAPQGSRVGPLVWNVMYDDFLRMDLPAGTSIIPRSSSPSLDSRCLKMAPEKTEAFLVTDRKSVQYPRIVLRKHKIE